MTLALCLTIFFFRRLLFGYEINFWVNCLKTPPEWVKKRILQNGKNSFFLFFFLFLARKVFEGKSIKFIVFDFEKFQLLLRMEWRLFMELVASFRSLSGELFYFISPFFFRCFASAPSSFITFCCLFFFPLMLWYRAGLRTTACLHANCFNLFLFSSSLSSDFHVYLNLLWVLKTHYTKNSLEMLFKLIPMPNNNYWLIQSSPKLFIIAS